MGRSSSARHHPCSVRGLAQRSIAPMNDTHPNRPSRSTTARRDSQHNASAISRGSTRAHHSISALVPRHVIAYPSRIVSALDLSTIRQGNPAGDLANADDRGSFDWSTRVRPTNDRRNGEPTAANNRLPSPGRCVSYHAVASSRSTMAPTTNRTWEAISRNGGPSVHERCPSTRIQPCRPRRSAHGD